MEKQHIKVFNHDRNNDIKSQMVELENKIKSINDRINDKINEINKNNVVLDGMPDLNTLSVGESKYYLKNDELYMIILVSPDKALNYKL